MAGKPRNSTSGQHSLPESSASNADSIEAAIHADYRTFQYLFVEFLTAHLADCSRTFRGDLQQMLILAIIGQVALNDAKRDAVRMEKDTAAALPWGTISASRIADVTGIPRESVRRKLLILEGKGWIVRNEEAQWQIARRNNTAVAREHLSDLDRRSIRRWAELLSAAKAQI